MSEIVDMQGFGQNGFGEHAPGTTMERGPDPAGVDAFMHRTLGHALAAARVTGGTALSLGEVEWRRTAAVKDLSRVDFFPDPITGEWAGHVIQPSRYAETMSQ